MRVCMAVGTAVNRREDSCVMASGSLQKKTSSVRKDEKQRRKDNQDNQEDKEDKTKSVTASLFCSFYRAMHCPA